MRAYLEAIANAAAAILKRLPGPRQRATVPPIPLGHPTFDDHVLQAINKCKCIPEPLHAPLMAIVRSARIVGVSEERARIAAIMELPGARDFPRLAWSFAKSGDSSTEDAERGLADAAIGPGGAVVIAAACAEREVATIH
jgi:hypothetical protein